MNDRDAVEEPLLTLAQAWEALNGMRSEHVELVRQAVTDPTGLGPNDHLVVAALRRSVANMEGFRAMVEQRNIFCAMPLIRFQLDSAMRVFACTLVDDITAFVSHLLKGKKLWEFEERRLTDGLLKDELAKKHEHVEEVYDYTSGYVHLSNLHLIGVLDVSQSEGEKLAFTDCECLPPWKEDAIGEALLHFIWATEILLEVCKVCSEREAVQK